MSTSSNIFVPPLNIEHVRRIFKNHVRSKQPLRYCAGLYLRELNLIHNQNLLELTDAPLYLPDKHDLEMYFMGSDAPLTLLTLSLFTTDHRFSAMREKFRLPHLEGTKLAKRADRYDTEIYCRVFAVNDHLKPETSETLTAFFDNLCDRPFFRNEPYFLGGVEASKLLYLTTYDALLIMEENKNKNQAGSPPAF